MSGVMPRLCMREGGAKMKRLGTSGTVREGKTLAYRASELDCDVCNLKIPVLPKGAITQDPARYP